MSNLSDQLKGIFSSIGGGSSGLAGIDVGMSGIKVCEIDKTGNQYLLKSFGYAPLSEGVIVDGDFHKKELLIEAIKSAFTQGEIKNKNVCYGFPSQNTVIKKMHAPNGSKQEIEDHISWEAEQFIPFGVDNAVISIHTLDKKDKDGVDVIMVAARLDQVQNYDQVLQEAGLKVKVIDLQALALLNIFEITYKEELAEFSKGTLLIDFGAQTTKIMVYKDGIPLFTKTLSIGGISVTEEIQKVVGLSFEEAEDLKLMRDDQGNPPEEISNVIKNVSEKIISQVKDAVSFYTASSSQDRVTRCLITGGNLQLPGVVEGLATATGLSIEILDPLKKIKIKSKKISPEMLEQITFVGAIPIGLAIRGYL